MRAAHHARHGEEKPRQRDAPHDAHVQPPVSGERRGSEPIAPARRRAIADLDHHHVPRLAESGRPHFEARRPEPRERAKHGHEIRQEPRQARHRVPDAHHLGPEPYSCAVNEVLVEHVTDVERDRAGGDEPPHRTQRTVPRHADELREVVAAADGHHAEHGARPAPTLQQTVRDLVHRAVTAHGHHAPGSRPDGTRRELDAVPGTIGTFRLHGPALTPELAHDGVERPRRRTAPRGRIEDDVGMDQRPHYKH